jgi:aspartate aminotransferase
VAFINAALKYNLLLVPGSGFAGPGYFRIAYCVAKETILRSLPYFTKLAEEFKVGMRHEAEGMRRKA